MNIKKILLFLIVGLLFDQLGFGFSGKKDIEAEIASITKIVQQELALLGKLEKISDTDVAGLDITSDEDLGSAVSTLQFPAELRDSMYESIYGTKAVASFKLWKDEIGDENIIEDETMEGEVDITPSLIFRNVIMGKMLDSDKPIFKKIRELFLGDLSVEEFKKAEAEAVEAGDAPESAAKRKKFIHLIGNQRGKAKKKLKGMTDIKEIASEAELKELIKKELSYMNIIMPDDWNEGEPLKVRMSYEPKAAEFEGDVSGQTIHTIMAIKSGWDALKSMDFGFQEGVSGIIPGEISIRVKDDFFDFTKRTKYNSDDPDQVVSSISTDTKEKQKALMKKLGLLVVELEASMVIPDLSEEFSELNVVMPNEFREESIVAKVKLKKGSELLLSEEVGTSVVGGGRHSKRISAEVEKEGMEIMKGLQDILGGFSLKLASYGNVPEILKSSGDPELEAIGERLRKAMEENFNPGELQAIESLPNKIVQMFKKFRVILKDIPKEKASIKIEYPVGEKELKQLIASQFGGGGLEDEVTFDPDAEVTIDPETEKLFKKTFGEGEYIPKDKLDVGSLLDAVEEGIRTMQEKKQKFISLIKKGSELSKRLPRGARRMSEKMIKMKEELGKERQGMEEKYISYEIEREKKMVMLKILWGKIVESLRELSDKTTTEIEAELSTESGLSELSIAKLILTEIVKSKADQANFYPTKLIGVFAGRGRNKNRCYLVFSSEDSFYSQYISKLKLDDVPMILKNETDNTYFLTPDDTTSELNTAGYEGEESLTSLIGDDSVANGNGYLAFKLESTPAPEVKEAIENKDNNLPLYAYMIFLDLIFDSMKGRDYLEESSKKIRITGDPESINLLSLNNLSWLNLLSTDFDATPYHLDLISNIDNGDQNHTGDPLGFMKIIEYNGNSYIAIRK